MKSHEEHDIISNQLILCRNTQGFWLKRVKKSHQRNTHSKGSKEISQSSEYKALKPTKAKEEKSEFVKTFHKKTMEKLR